MRRVGVCRSRSRGTAGASSSRSQDGGRFHIRAGGNESRRAVRTAASTGRTCVTIYVPWAEGMTEDMVKKGAGAFVQAEGTVKTFSKGI